MTVLTFVMTGIPVNAASATSPEPRATSPAPAQRNRQHQLSVYSRELKTKSF